MFHKNTILSVLKENADGVIMQEGHVEINKIITSTAAKMYRKAKTSSGANEEMYAYRLYQQLYPIITKGKRPNAQSIALLKIVTKEALVRCSTRTRDRLRREVRNSILAGNEYPVTVHGKDGVRILTTYKNVKDAKFIAQKFSTEYRDASNRLTSCLRKWDGILGGPKTVAEAIKAAEAKWKAQQTQAAAPTTAMVPTTPQTPKKPTDPKGPKGPTKSGTAKPIPTMPPKKPTGRGPRVPASPTINRKRSKLK